MLTFFFVSLLFSQPTEKGKNKQYLLKWTSIQSRTWLHRCMSERKMRPLYSQCYQLIASHNLNVHRVNTIRLWLVLSMQICHRCYCCHVYCGADFPLAWWDARSVLFSGWMWCKESETQKASDNLGLCRTQSTMGSNPAARRRVRSRWCYICGYLTQLAIIVFYHFNTYYFETLKLNNKLTKYINTHEITRLSTMCPRN